MKELTIEQKAKVYDEALERAKVIIRNYESRNLTNVLFYAKEYLSFIFPELKESEDEKMMNQLHSWMKEFGGAEEYTEKVYQWIKGLLEKQGERKPMPEPIFRTGNTLRRKGKDYTFIVDRIQGGYYHCDHNNGAFFPIEEQDKWELVEQKPADKVEPKFKNGQWVVWLNKCYKVNYNGCGYEVIDQNGLTTSLEYGTIDENAHLWDITKDVREGDVLVSGDVIFIFNKIHGEWVNCHCSLFKDKSFMSEDYDLMQIRKYGKETYPATKEQRELLFQKMKEAGYEWDSEHKQLLKVEQECHCNGVREPKEATGVLKQLLNKENYAWSEEDEAYRVDILVKLEPHITDDNFTDVQNWFKSIKDRVQTQSKQEWSEDKGL